MTNFVSESFRQRADSAAFYEAWVGCVLSRAGMFTIHRPFTIAKSSGEAALHAHTWDIDVSNIDPAAHEGLTLVPVEVKSINLTFHNVEDYPYDTVLICSLSSFLKKWGKTKHTERDFLFVSRPTGSVLWLPKFSTVYVGNEVYDKSRGELYKAVSAKKSLLRDLTSFVEMVKS